MAKRDPEKTRRNRIASTLTDKLKAMEHSVLRETGIKSAQSLNGIYGGKHREYSNIQYTVFHSPHHFISEYLRGFERAARESHPGLSHYENWRMLEDSPILRRYLAVFLARTFYREYDRIAKVRPTEERSEIWIAHLISAPTVRSRTAYAARTNSAGATDLAHGPATHRGPGAG